MCHVGLAHMRRTYLSRTPYDFKNVMISQAAHHQHYITEEEEEEVKYTRRSVQHSQFNWQNERANGFLCKQIQYFI